MKTVNKTDLWQWRENRRKMRLPQHIRIEHVSFLSWFSFHVACFFIWMYVETLNKPLKLKNYKSLSHTLFTDAGPIQRRVVRTKEGATRTIVIVKKSSLKNLQAKGLIQPLGKCRGFDLFDLFSAANKLIVYSPTPWLGKKRTLKRLWRWWYTCTVISCSTIVFYQVKMYRYTNYRTSVTCLCYKQGVGQVTLPYSYSLDPPKFYFYYNWLKNIYLLASSHFQPDSEPMDL